MLKVVLIEDEPIILKGLLYRMDWLHSGCVVAGTAENGVKGAQLIAETNPDIVITDIRMPFKDGLEMLKETKEIYQYEAIILSGYGEFNYAQQAISLGVRDYLLKPIDLNELAESLKRLSIEIKEHKQQENEKQQSNVMKDLLSFNVASDGEATYAAEAVRFIKRYYDQKITLVMLSEEVGLSTVSMNTKLKEATGYSFNEFLTRYRITKALDKLQNEKVLVYEVAETTGFSDYKYFSHVFKKYIGMSPKQFLKDSM
ncbi:response regulator transcription factor [Alkalicoccobacillus porphyridii]|uniref:Response regulator n=1 Tax=Alkalicoccobacillus porphyridii TaxID=2597270 RepID=A0A554A137_9BACI|nr:response regulator [Alkalicoccobacillus porphyridii]TSB47399.1 response regulator [Alkalicoccobacillus porphyridii]